MRLAFAAEPGNKKLIFAAIGLAVAGFGLFYFFLRKQENSNHNSSSSTKPVAIAAAAVAATAAVATAIASTATDAVTTTFKKGAVSDFIKFQLVERIRETHNTFIFRFALPSADHQALGVPALKHVAVRMMLPAPPAAEGSGSGDEGKLVAVQRTYTPLTSDFEMIQAAAASNSNDANKPRTFDLLIKVYEKGAMSTALAALPIGATVDMRGATGLHEYLGNGVFAKLSKRKRASVISMATAGTGLTPMIQLLKAVLIKNPERETYVKQVYGMYANSTLDDVLEQAWLERIAAAHADKFRLQFNVSRKTSTVLATAADNTARESSWKYNVGRIDEKSMREFLPAPAKVAAAPGADGVLDVGTIVILCGPPGMVTATQENLRKLGYVDDQIFVM